MTEYTKPCGRPGCSTLIRHRWAYWVAHRRYCSGTCSAQHRIATGYQMPRPTFAQSQAGGRKGGAIGGARARKAALVKAAAQCQKFIDPEMRMRLTHAQQAKLTVLIARAYLWGHDNGMQCERERRRAKDRAKEAA